MVNESERELSITDRTPLLADERNSVTKSDDSSSASLRRVADSFPLRVWLVVTIEFCEGFAYAGILGPLQNYMQYAADDPLRPGGIGAYTTNDAVG